MKFSFILVILLPAICFSQQPVKPTLPNNTNTLSIDILNADLPMITGMIKNINEQIKGLKDELVVLRNQQTAIAGGKQKMQFEINQLESKTNRTQEETARLAQSKNEIKNIEVKIETMNQQIGEISESISRLEVDLQLMEEKLKELESKDKNQHKKEEQQLNNLKNDPVRLYARVKTIYDSLSIAERAKLNATQNKTLSYYNNLYNSNINFKSSVSKEIKTNFLNTGVVDAKENTMVMKDSNSLMLTRLKDYLDMLGAIERK